MKSVLIILSLIIISCSKKSKTPDTTTEIPVLITTKKEHKVVDKLPPKGIMSLEDFTVLTDGNQEDFKVSKSKNLDTLYIQKILYKSIDDAIIEFNSEIIVEEVNESLLFGIKQYTIDDNPAGPIGIDLSREITHIGDQRVKLSDTEENKDWLEKTHFQMIKDTSIAFQMDFYNQLLKDKKKYAECCPEYIKQAQNFINTDPSNFTNLDSLRAYPYIKENLIRISYLKNKMEVVKFILYNTSL